MRRLNVSLLLMCLAFKASASEIQGYGNTSADYGGEAVYTCKLQDPKDVLQVTWQRLSEDSWRIENLATYSKQFGEQVNGPYQGKIVLTEVSLHSTSITVKNLTWVDESCYVCMFNTYPGGSKTHQTCLKVQGVSEVKTNVYASIDDPKGQNKVVTFGCTATGKPAPRIQWEHLHHTSQVEESATSVLVNGDHTLTSSRNLTLQLSPDWDDHVDCVINPGLRGEKREIIMFTWKKEKPENYTFVIPIVVIIAILLGIFLFGFLLWIKRHMSRPSTRHDMI